MDSVLTITSRDNDRVRQVYRLARSREFRREQGLYVCEGFVMLEEAAKSGAKIAGLFVETGMEHRVAGIDAEAVYSVAPHVLEKLSLVGTPQGVVFTCRIEGMRELPSGGILALDGIKDPGNLGTIIRSADAFSFTGIVLLGECVDVFSPKVVRASMGSVFRMGCVEMSLDTLCDFARARGLALYCADAGADALDVREVDLQKACVVVGGEADGVSRPVRAACAQTVKIPIERAESLNAAMAATVLMWETRRAKL